MSESRFRAAVVHVPFQLDETQLNALVRFEQVKELDEIEAWIKRLVMKRVDRLAEDYRLELAEEQAESEYSFDDEEDEVLDDLFDDDEWDDDEEEDG